jgi:hypothetical protein
VHDLTGSTMVDVADPGRMMIERSVSGSASTDRMFIFSYTP